MNVGDVVFLNSNPEILMTIEFVLGSETSGLQERMLDQQMKMRGYSDGDVYCTWFENKELKHDVFKKQMVIKK